MSTYISNIQKFCVDDGPGIWTVVFFMGCPLRCKWCQNPENFEQSSRLMVDSSKCSSCGACLICPNGANKLIDGKMVFDREKCDSCGKCIDVCRNNVREIAGKIMTEDEVYAEVVKDKVFFDNTNGGITLSGGECTTQPDFAVSLLKRFQNEKVHTAIETSGFCSNSTILRFAECVDLFLYDIKAVSSDIHLKWTGISNDIIKENLECLVRLDKKIIIRIPLIPGVNTGKELEKIAQYLLQLEKIKEIHILPFHQLGSSRYALSGVDYELDKMEECSIIDAETAKTELEKYGFKVNVGGWDS